jgi:hypothetical protein
VAEFLQIVTGFSQMPVKLLSESMAASITDDDARRIDEILSFWFKEQELSAPQIDRRMDIWFGENPDFDDEVEAKFSDDVARASTGKLDHWAEDPRGRLALIILIDQFPSKVQWRKRTKVLRQSKKYFSTCHCSTRNHARYRPNPRTCTAAWRSPSRLRTGRPS